MALVLFVLILLNGIFSQGCMLICVVLDIFLSRGVKLSLPVIGAGVII